MHSIDDESFAALGQLDPVLLQIEAQNVRFVLSYLRQRGPARMICHVAGR